MGCVLFTLSTISVDILLKTYPNFLQKALHFLICNEMPNFWSQNPVIISKGCKETSVPIDELRIGYRGGLNGDATIG